jgi:hypothetical protein
MLQILLLFMLKQSAPASNEISDAKHSRNGTCYRISLHLAGDGPANEIGGAATGKLKPRIFGEVEKESSER